MHRHLLCWLDDRSCFWTSKHLVHSRPDQQGQSASYRFNVRGPRDKRETAAGNGCGVLDAARLDRRRLLQTWTREGSRPCVCGSRQGRVILGALWYSRALISPVGSHRCTSSQPLLEAQRRTGMPRHAGELAGGSYTLWATWTSPVLTRASEFFMRRAVAACANRPALGVVILWNKTWTMVSRHDDAPGRPGYLPT